ncbi:MAG: efflux RND transporter periplasmic adaptor subunit [Magnetococcales bacterium]|nr:efflux RND transporter periplasmic adaptor subunit [Magnetococcales bacterium]
MKTHSNIWISLFILLLLAGGGYYWNIQKPATTPTQSADLGNSPPQVLEILTLAAQDVRTLEEAPGRTVAYQIAEIRPQVSGIVTERLFTEGALVKEGQQLYQIDPAAFRASHARAQADLKKAQANLSSVEAKNRRYSELVKIDAVSRQQYDDTQASLAQALAEIAIAEATVAQARISLDYTKVHAPISGQIGKSRVTKGALVTANQAQTLSTITQLDPIYVDLSLASDSLMRLRQQVGTLEQVPVQLYFETNTAPYPHKGQLLFHEMAVDESTGMVSLRARFPNPDTLLLPGQFVHAQLELVHPNSLLIPQKASQRQADGTLSVWLLDEQNKAQSTTIKTTRAVGDAWLVTDGLKAGDRLISEGTINLKPGATVQPQEPQPTSFGSGR